MALRWHEPGERFSSSARFIGDTTLVQSLWAIACARGLAIELKLMPAQATPHAAERRALAEGLRERIAASLQH